MSRHQISGSLSLDMSGVAGAVRDELAPQLTELADAVRLVAAMAAPEILDVTAATEVLSLHAQPGRAPAEVAAALDRAGYALMVREQVTSPEAVAPDWFDPARSS